MTSPSRKTSSRLYWTLNPWIQHIRESGKLENQYRKECQIERRQLGRHQRGRHQPGLDWVELIVVFLFLLLLNYWSWEVPSWGMGAIWMGQGEGHMGRQSTPGVCPGQKLILSLNFYSVSFLYASCVGLKWAFSVPEAGFLWVWVVIKWAIDEKSNTGFVQNLSMFKPYLNIAQASHEPSMGESTNLGFV